MQYVKWDRWDRANRIRRSGVLCAAAAVMVSALAMSACSVGKPSVRIDDLIGPDGTEIGFLLPPVYVAKKDAKYEQTLNIRRITQEHANWCWAACAQMVHEYHGRSYTQRELADRIHGGNPRPAAYREILIALNPHLLAPEIEELMKTIEAIDENNPSVNLVQFARNLNAHFAATSDDIVKALLDGNPVVVVLDETHDLREPDATLADYVMEHAYVVSGVGYVNSNSLWQAIADLVHEVYDLFRGSDDNILDPVIAAIERLHFDYAIAWVELIDPDRAAVECGEEVEAGAPPRPRAVSRMPADEFAKRLNVILAPQPAEPGEPRERYQYYREFQESWRVSR